MRGFLNAPNGSSKQPLTTIEKHDNDLSQSPFGGETVLQVVKFKIDEFLSSVFESNYCFCPCPYCRMSLTFHSTWAGVKLKKTFVQRCLQ